MIKNSQSSILSLLKLTTAQQTATTSREPAISVTAGAGSGKTSTLVGRYLSLLESGVPLRSLVAITFTEKAAREMRNRIRALTAAWLEQAETAPNRAVWAEAFSALDAARIGTIHGLCAAILRAHPAEAGLDPAFTVLDEGQSALGRARAVDAGLAWAVTNPDVAQLFGFWPEAHLRRLLAELLARRLDAEQALNDLTDDPLAVWAAALNQWLTGQLAQPAWQQSLATLAALQAQKEDDKLELARREVLAHWAEATQAQANQDWDKLFDALPALRAAISSGGQKGNWAADDLAAAREAMSTLRAHFDQVVSRLVDKKKPARWSLDCQAAQLLPLVRRLFAHTGAIYQDYKNESQSLDFDDLEQMTARLLVHNRAVRTRWQQQINAVLLVDEFQDTNQRQRDIVYALAGFEPSASSLPPIPYSLLPTPQSSSLFIVGDAKQSIYRFRGADVAVFRQVQADIKAAGGTLIDFDLTFRAHQPLVELTNALLAPLMPAQDDSSQPYDVPFTPLTAFRKEPRALTNPPYLEFQLGLGEDKAEGRLAAAIGLTHRLHHLQRSGQITWQDVALLFRASTAFGVYEDALEQAGIPFVTVAGRGFYDRPEIRDLLNALAAIADPTDDLAMAGLLRSPAIGLSDGAIHLLRWGKDSTRRSFWPALHTGEALAELAGDDREQAEFARQLIARLHAQAGRITVAQLLKAFLDATHYRAVLRLASGGERLRRNVDKLLTNAHRSQLVSVPEFLEYMAALRDVGVRESEAPTETGGAVQLMTVHKAKGLEFPVVVLADAGYTGGSRSAPFCLDQQLGLVLNLTDGEARPATVQLAAWREAEQEAAEERRLLYVAATRAMEKFIISGNARVSTAKTNPGRLMVSGWLAQLAQVVGLDQTQLPATPVTAQAISLDWQAGAAGCTIYPPVSTRASFSAETPAEGHPPPALSQAPDLLAPLTAAPSAEPDEKLKTRESDPPPRVWQVAPPTHYDVPAWVVGSLTHVALHYWHFPDGQNWAGFLRPFALEAGLSDPRSITIALQRVSKLLTRFQAHPLYRQLSIAERHHELPYSVNLNGQTQDGLIDLLFRSSPDAAWTIAEFKTDRLAENIDLKIYAQQKGYIRQVEAYQQAVWQQMGTSPEALLIFLNVAQLVQVLSLPGCT